MNLRWFLCLLFAASALTGFQCTKNNKRELHPCYKGRLEIKGMCMNYTIKVLEGSMDASLIEKSWKDPQTGKVHENVFALKSQCSFPQEINEGDEFYFTINTNTGPSDCAVCMGFYPKPEKGLSIAVSKTSCN